MWQGISLILALHQYLARDKDITENACGGGVEAAPMYSLALPIIMCCHAYVCRGTDTHDYMWTTPNRLFLVLDNTLRAYSLMADAAQDKLAASEESVSPRKIRLMRELRDEVVRRYL